MIRQTKRVVWTDDGGGTAERTEEDMATYILEEVDRSEESVLI